MFCTGLIRAYCTKAARPIPVVKKAVIVSTSNDIYANLAMEDWLYKNGSFKDNHLLMLWSNDPCVVIGRHQNPWTEANVDGAKLARRNSGGGTVYHDRGNLNLTFFTAKEHYNRRYNLEFIAKSIFEEYGVKVEISPREDLTVHDYKISGTAAKLGRLTAYHHCTLLVNADLTNLRTSLEPCNWHITTNATKSVKSIILNLAEENSDISVDGLLKSIGISYLNHNNANNTEDSRTISDRNSSFTPKNHSYLVGAIDFDSPQLQLVSPDDLTFPGVSDMRADLMDWKWLHGRTPNFKATKKFTYQSGGKKFPKVIYTTSRTYVVVVSISVESGVVTEADAQLPDLCSQKDAIKSKVQLIKGQQFAMDVLAYLDRVFSGDDDVGVVKRFVNK